MLLNVRPIICTPNLRYTKSGIPYTRLIYWLLCLFRGSDPPWPWSSLYSYSNSHLPLLPIFSIFSLRRWRNSRRTVLCAQNPVCWQRNSQFWKNPSIIKGNLSLWLWIVWGSLWPWWALSFWADQGRAELHVPESWEAGCTVVRQTPLRLSWLLDRRLFCSCRHSITWW